MPSTNVRLFHLPGQHNKGTDHEFEDFTQEMGQLASSDLEHNSSDLECNSHYNGNTYQKAQGFGIPKHHNNNARHSGNQLGRGVGNQLSSHEYRQAQAHINDLECENNKLKRQLAAMTHAVAVPRNNHKNDKPINADATTTTPLDGIASLSKDKVAQRLCQLTGKYNVMYLLWIGNIEETFNIAPDPNYQPDHRFMDAEGRQQGEYFDLLKALPRAYCDPSKIANLYFQTHVYKSIVHGPSSLDQPNSLKGFKECKWDVSEITPGAIATTEICARFALSCDGYFQHQGSATHIDYEADFYTYLEFLSVNNSIVKKIFSLWNQELYAVTSANTTATSEGPWSSVKTVLATLKAMHPLNQKMVQMVSFSAEMLD
ncbi:hypothetical protein BU17DRAFT_92094 [Hysterangium stoloniferum]|nr:hypothetical protein BU17DRAFT_92094 [Hysterangium stoloniferum]